MIWGMNYYINIKRDREKGMEYVEKGLAINPTDETLVSIKNQLSKQPPPKTETKTKEKTKGTK